MHQRSELEQPCTLAEMQMVIDTFEKDFSEYLSTEVRHRIGVTKIVIEEYLPLFLMAQSLPGFKSARLTADSHQGPDAILLFDDESQATIQITCAGEDECTALQRELLDNGQIVFANQSVNRVRKTGEISQSGRILTTRNSNTLAAIDEVLSAIEKKTHKYRVDTLFLLIGVRRTERSMMKDWRQRLLAAVSALTDSPYERIYVVIDHTCFRCDQSAQPFAIERTTTGKPASSAHVSNGGASLGSPIKHQNDKPS